MKTGAAWLLLAALVFLPVFGARAEQISGSIRVELPAQAADAELTLCRVAEMDGTDYYYAEGSPFAGSGVSLEGLGTAEKAVQAAEQLAAYAAENGIAGTPMKPDGELQVSWQGLQAGLYLMVQTSGKEQADIQKTLVSVPGIVDGQVLYDIRITAKYTLPEGAVILNKTDDAGGAVPGVTFLLQKKTYVTEDGALPEGAESGSDVGGRWYWQTQDGSYVTDANGQIVVRSLQLGTYRFQEQSAPGGYIMTKDPLFFEIRKAGSVTAEGGRYLPADDGAVQVTAQNERTRVLVNKIDEEGNGVAGAALSILDNAGNVVQSAGGEALGQFVTTAEAREIRGLPAGQYFLREDAAPRGYERAADVPFVVAGDTSEPVTVTMIDAEQKGSLSVTKNLRTPANEEVVAPEAVFYVALFSNEARTQRASEVVPMEFQNAASQTVTFTGLALDRTYYVSETDQSGAPLDNGTIGDGGVFSADFPNGRQISLTVEAPAGAVQFENVFSEVPRNYYYEGKLSITKRVLRGGEPENSNETFYAGIFEDAAYTSRVGDVVALAMNGSSERTAEVPVSIGRNAEDSVTYYVTETNAEGIPAAGAEGFAYTVSVDKTSVTMSPGHDTESVVITNERPAPAEGEITVTKYLKTLAGDDMKAVDSTFCVALFADEARTQRVSDVKTMQFKDASRKKVRFTGLSFDTAYYVSETDETGAPIDSGTTPDGGTFGAVFADGNLVQLTASAPEGAVEFENVFTELPRGYSREGTLTITKRVLRGGALAGSYDTFYAGIFEDPEYRHRVGDVIELAMGGNSERRVEVPVSVGLTENDSVTYYVTETDEYGEPVADSASFAYHVSIDKTSVTMSSGHDRESVVITNTDEDAAVTPADSDDSEFPITPTRSVQTGDETPIAVYLAVFAGSVLLILGLLFFAKRDRML